MSRDAHFRLPSVGIEPHGSTIHDGKNRGGIVHPGFLFELLLTRVDRHDADNRMAT